MHQRQINYALDRAKEMYRAGCDAIEERHTRKAVSLSREEKHKALRAGKFTIKVGCNQYYWHDAIKFTDERDEHKDHAAIDREKDVLSAAYRKLTDELVLGTEAEAMRLLKEFTALTKKLK